MNRTLLPAAFALTLLGCVAESTGDSPTTATGGASAEVVACACPGQALAWVSYGFPGEETRDSTTVDGCAKATVTRTSYRRNGQTERSCEQEVAPCGEAGAVTLDEIAQALGHPDVKSALAESKASGEPAGFGWVPPAAWDTPFFEVTVDGATLQVGAPCGSLQGCTEPPPGLAALPQKLEAIAAEIRGEATCAAKLAPAP